MWPAHLLTLCRIPLAAGMWFAHGGWAVALVGLAALTDALDGTVARWLKRRGATTSDIGGWLDPLVDKLFVVIAFAAMASYVELEVLLLLAAREILLVPIGILYLVRRVKLGELRADAIGKVATVAQLIALAIVLGAPQYGLVAAVIAGGLGTAAAVVYGWRSSARSNRIHSVTRPVAQREMSITASSAP